MLTASSVWMRISTGWSFDIMFDSDADVTGIVLSAIHSMLIDPASGTDYPLDPYIADLYKTDRVRYDMRL